MGQLRPGDRAGGRGGRFLTAPAGDLILGLDPGSRHTGYGIVASGPGGLEALDYGRISTDSAAPLPRRLAELADGARGLVARWSPAVAALETPFHGLNSRSLIVLAQARGALLAALAAERLEIREYAPAEVKSAVSGNGRADKEQVARMVRMLLALGEERLSRDASDALAVAICCAHRAPLERLVEAR